MKKTLRAMTWDDYGISKNRYKELKAFCMQYDEKKKKIRSGNPVEKSIMAYDCKMIENAAEETDNALQQHILKSVTKNMTYEMLKEDREFGKIFVGKTDFYAYRRLFYSKLNKVKIH